MLKGTQCIAVSIAEASAICNAIKNSIFKGFAEGDKWASNPLIVLS